MEMKAASSAGREGSLRDSTSRSGAAQGPGAVGKERQHYREQPEEPCAMQWMLGGCQQSPACSVLSSSTAVRRLMPTPPCLRQGATP